MGKHRPLSDRIAEAQAQLAALKAKTAKSEIDKSPEIQAIDKDIKTVQTSMLKYNRWAAEGEEKVTNFLRRADEWKQRIVEANDKRAEANKEIAALRNKRKALVEDLASSIEIDG